MPVVQTAVKTLPSLRLIETEEEPVESKTTDAPPAKDKEAHNALYWRSRCLKAEADIRAVDCGSMQAALDFYAARTNWKGDEPAAVTDAGRRARLALQAVKNEGESE